MLPCVRPLSHQSRDLSIEDQNPGLESSVLESRDASYDQSRFGNSVEDLVDEIAESTGSQTK